MSKADGWDETKYGVSCKEGWAILLRSTSTRLMELVGNTCVPPSSISHWTRQIWSKVHEWMAILIRSSITKWDQESGKEGQGVTRADGIWGNTWHPCVPPNSISQ